MIQRYGFRNGAQFIVNIDVTNYATLEHVAQEYYDLAEAMIAEGKRRAEKAAGVANTEQGK